MVILLDYDGTLTPIVARPDKAKIEKGRKDFLEKLSKKHTLAIVTGRSMDSFKEVFGSVPNTVYLITSHGAKVYKGEELVKELTSNSLPDLTPLKRVVEEKEGLILEEKDGCFALHYRNFKGTEEEVKRLFREFIDRHPPHTVLEGKKVLEAVYSDRNKGKAVEDFLKLLGWDGREKVIYIGDDTTDLYALRKVREIGGLPVFVGENKPPEAELLLKNVDEVYEFLSGLK